MASLSLVFYCTLRATSVFFSALRVIRAPLIVVILAAIVLSVPDQFLEVYRTLAQDLIIKSHFVPRYQELLCAGFTFCLLILSIWHSTSLLTVSSLHRSTDELTPKLVLKYAPAVLVLILFGGLCIGILRAQTQPISQSILDAAIDPLAEMLGDSQPNPFLRQVLARVAAQLGNASHDFRLFVLILALIGAAFVAILVRRLGPQKYRDNILPLRWATLGKTVVLAAITIAVFAVPGTGFPVAFGPLAVFFIFCCLLLFVFHNLTRLSKRIRIPLLSTLLALSFIFSAFNLNDNHPIYELSSHSSGGVGENPRSLDDAFDKWFNSRSDREFYKLRGKPYPIYVFAAQGGGIYAAFHAAMVLSGLQDRCSLFRDHLFAISGVSGGSLGAAVFNGLTRVIDKKTPIKEPCRVDRTSVLESPFVQSADVVLSQDFLSPLVSSFFFGEAVQRILPYPIDLLDRGRALEKSFEEAFSDFLAQTQAASMKPSNPMSLPYSSHWTAEGTSPALLINTTEVGSGRRRVIAPFTFAGADLLFLPVSGARAINLPLSTAAGLSARFPWLSPAAYFRDVQTRVKGRNQLIRLVDGGYFDNSGVSTALDLIRGIEQFARHLKIEKDLRVVLVVLTGGGYGELPFLGLSELFSPVFTLLSTRAARGYISIEQAERELSLSNITSSRSPSRVRKVHLETSGYEWPLGWRLSPVSQLLLRAQAGSDERCIDVKSGNATSGHNADCLMRTIVNELMAR